MNKFFIFDLDDTLYKEIDYLKSGFRAVSKYLTKHLSMPYGDIYRLLIFYYKSNENSFNKIKDNYNLQVSVKTILKIYREHEPNIHLSNNAKDILNYMKNNGSLLGLMTDGRSQTQRNKIKALKLEKYLNHILISEEFGTQKPHVDNYLHFMQIHKFSLKKKYYYIGDNTSKDFLTANNLGWMTICLLDNGSNIHKQDFSLDKKYLPRHTIKNLSELTGFIND